MQHIGHVYVGCSLPPSIPHEVELKLEDGGLFLHACRHEARSST
jgi:hypothetical protein